MKLDLRKDFDAIYAHVVQRVRDFNPAKNAGPGPKKAPISMMEFGYQCDQAGWVALVFDTRPDAESDGEWNAYIEQNAFECPHWQEAAEALENEAVNVTLPDGKKRKIAEYEALVVLLGDLLKAVLLKARAEGVFQSLPKASRCSFGVEEHDGGYGWPQYEDRGKEDLV